MSEEPRVGGGDELVAIQNLEPGTKVHLRGGIVAEVTENPRDGMWIVVRYLETAAGPLAAERIEMAAADDVLARVEK
jgi:preprotein translocase subunit YajC